MFDRKPRSALRRIALSGSLVAASVGVAAVCLPAAAGAALVTPASLTSCAGSLEPDASGPSQGEDNLLDYKLDCSTDITAYTVFVVRQQDAGNNIQNFATNSTVVYPSTWPANPALAGTPSSELGTCEGETPSDSINCFASAIGSDGKTTVLGTISAYLDIEGSIALDEPYCKYLPKGAKPGTAAVPTALVGVIVTDDTGAEDGPFYIRPAKACAKVPNTVPKPAKRKHKKAK